MQTVTGSGLVHTKKEIPDNPEHARCVECDWEGTRSQSQGDSAACPECGSGTARHNSPSNRVDYKQQKMEKVLGEFKHGNLHSGSDSGPKVKSRKQAIAIGLSMARKHRPL